MKDWVYSQDIIAIWIVWVPFEGNIVEVRKVLGQFLCVLTLFNDVLLLKPEPWLIDFTKVLHNQLISLHTFFSEAENTNAFRMNTEMNCILGRQILDSIIYDSGNLYILSSVLL